MLALFIRCASCDLGLDSKINRRSFPLCSNCAESLVQCPLLCSQCGSPVCPTQSENQCTRPWINPKNLESNHPSIHSYSGRYLLFETGYTVLRKWKIRRGTLFDRQILRTTPQLTQQWTSFSAQAVIPIPQNFHRAWKMGGSRAEIIARWIGGELHLPVLDLLQFAPPIYAETQAPKRQAELNLMERLQSRNRFHLYQRLPSSLQRMILVDDFMTTGHTLKQAAQTLLNADRQSNPRQVHAFCLGVRVRRLHTESCSHLLEGGGRPVTVR